MNAYSNNLKDLLIGLNCFFLNFLLWFMNSTSMHVNGNKHIIKDSIKDLNEMSWRLKPPKTGEGNSRFKYRQLESTIDR